MSFLDQLIDGAVQIGVAKAENPRTVQTLEQRQVSQGQQVNAQVSQPAPGSSIGSSFADIMRDKRVMIGASALALGLIAFLGLRSSK